MSGNLRGDNTGCNAGVPSYAELSKGHWAVGRAGCANVVWFDGEDVRPIGYLPEEVVAWAVHAMNMAALNQSRAEDSA